LELIPAHGGRVIHGVDDECVGRADTLTAALYILHVGGVAFYGGLEGATPTTVDKQSAVCEYLLVWLSDSLCADNEHRDFSLQILAHPEPSRHHYFQRFHVAPPDSQKLQETIPPWAWLHLSHRHVHHSVYSTRLPENQRAKFSRSQSRHPFCQISPMFHASLSSGIKKPTGLRTQVVRPRPLPVQAC